MISRIALLLTSALWFETPAQAITIAPECPPSVPLAIPSENVLAPNWKAHIASDLYLNSAAPMSGPPEMHGDLAEFTTKQRKSEWSYTYKLDRVFPNGKWLECGYGPHNQITLSQPLPDSVKACTFTYRKGQKAGQYNIKILCTE